MISVFMMHVAQQNMRSMDTLHITQHETEQWAIRRIDAKCIFHTVHCGTESGGSAIRERQSTQVALFFRRFLARVHARCPRILGNAAVAQLQTLPLRPAWEHHVSLSCQIFYSLLAPQVSWTSEVNFKFISVHQWTDEDMIDKGKSEGSWLHGRGEDVRVVEGKDDYVPLGKIVLVLSFIVLGT